MIEHTNLTLGFMDKYKSILNQWKRIWLWVKQGGGGVGDQWVK